MPDVHIVQKFDGYGVSLDWLLRPAGLDQTAELANAVIVALGTDSLADIDEILPDPDDTDRRGWWGDLDAQEIWGGWELGCRLWLLSRAKILSAAASEGGTVERVRQ